MMPLIFVQQIHNSYFRRKLEVFFSPGKFTECFHYLGLQTCYLPCIHMLVIWDIFLWNTGIRGLISIIISPLPPTPAIFAYFVCCVRPSSRPPSPLEEVFVFLDRWNPATRFYCLDEPSLTTTMYYSVQIGFRRLCVSCADDNRKLNTWDEMARPNLIRAVDQVKPNTITTVPPDRLDSQSIEPDVTAEYRISPVPSALTREHTWHLKQAASPEYRPL